MVFGCLNPLRTSLSSPLILPMIMTLNLISIVYRIAYLTWMWVHMEHCLFKEIFDSSSPMQDYPIKLALMGGT